MATAWDLVRIVAAVLIVIDAFINFLPFAVFVGLLGIVLVGLAISLYAWSQSDRRRLWSE